jgi:hypothetical protein
MRRIGLDDPGLDGIGQDTAQEPDGACSSSGTAADDGLSAQLPCLDGNACLPSDDVLQHLVDVSFG